MSKELITKEMLFVKNEDGQMILSEDAVENIRRIEIAKKKIDKDYKKYREAVLKGMEAYGLTKFESDELLVTYMKPSERVGIDNDKLWADYPEVAFKCQKETAVKSSVKITVR